MTFVDPVATPTLGRIFRGAGERSSQLERAPQFIAQAIPSEPRVARSTTDRWLLLDSTSWTTMAISRCTLTAQWLHYNVAYDTSMMVAATSLDWRLQIAVPTLTVNLFTRTETSSGTENSSADIFAALGSDIIYYGQQLTIRLQGRRVGGTGSIQLAYDNNLLLRAAA